MIGEFESLWKGFARRVDGVWSRFVFVRVTVTVLLFFLLSLIAIRSWQPSWGGGDRAFDKPEAAFKSMVDGTAHRPYVTRALVPITIISLDGLLPDSAAESLTAPLLYLGFGRHLPKNGEGADLKQFAIWIYLCLLSMMLLGEGMRRFLKSVYDGPDLPFMLWGALSIGVWPSLACYTGYMYDPFTATLFLWTIFAAHKKSWRLYYLLLFLAAVHKETSLLIPLAVAFYYWPVLPRRRLLARLSAELALVIAVRLLLTAIFLPNPGEHLETHLFEHNLNFLLAVHFTPKLLVIVLVVSGICLKDLGRKPRVAKAIALMLVPLAAMGFMVGFLDEIRAYSESYPGFMMLAFPTVFRRWL